MPITTPLSSTDCAAAMANARDKVKKKWKEMDVVLKQDQIDQMQQEIEAAALAALFAHLAANMTITIKQPGLQTVVSLGSPTGPPVAPTGVPLLPGSIT